MGAAICLAALWAAIGLWLVQRTGPRGPVTDVMLVLFWPLHVAAHLWRR